MGEQEGMYEGPGSERLSEISDELREIQQAILEKVEEAKYLLVEAGLNGSLEQAESYWMPHIICAVTKDHSYLGGSMYTLEDSIDAVDEAMSEAVEIETEKKAASASGGLTR